MRLLLLLLLAAVFARPAQADGWMPTANALSDARWAPSYCLLAGGARALVAGGYSFPAGRCVASADEFDPATRRFVRCRGRLIVPRDFAPAVPLPGGRVLICGGYNTVLGSLDSAELYDPKTQTFARLPARLNTPRELFTATVLGDGRILLAGGFNTHTGRTQATSEIYDPRTQAFIPAGLMLDDRFGHDAVRLADGRVLAVGGKHWFAGRPDRPLASAEVFDPATGRWHATGSPMRFARDRPTATLLADGTVLIAGGQDGPDEPARAERFDPKSETFTLLPAPLVSPRMAHAAATLPGGRVLLAGGWSTPLSATTGSVEAYDPAAHTFLPLPPLPDGVHDLALLAFPNGLVLAAGGKRAGGGRETSLASACTWQSDRP